MNQETYQQPQPTTEPSGTPAESPLPQKTCKGKSITIVLLVIVLLFTLATAATVFYGWRQMQMKQQQINLQITQLREALTRTHVLLAQQAQVLHLQRGEVQALLQKNQQTANSRVLIEVNYLVKLAAFYLTFGNNILLTQQLLEAADQRILADDNPLFWPLRRAIAQDIVMLNATPIVDLPGLVARLGALSRQAEILPELPVSLLHKTSNTTTLPTDAPSQTKTHWLLNKLQSFTLAIKDALSNMVIISKNNQISPSLLTTDQRLYIVTNIQSQLSLAQWAAVHRQTTIYKQSLLSVETWLQRYFSGDNPLVQGILKTVADLKMVPVNPSTPTISTSLDALQKMK